MDPLLYHIDASLSIDKDDSTREQPLLSLYGMLHADGFHSLPIQAVLYL